MKEWVVIHKIKALHDGGSGLSVRTIATELGISRNTVRKYLRMHEEAIGQTLAQTARHKELDAHRDYIVHLLRTYPNLSAVKVARKLRQKLGELAVSDRSIRRYVQAIKQEVATAQRRYYEPVLDDIPGVQCQVDPGELRDVLIGGEPHTLHFVVFVLSFSRLMYVGLSFESIDTERFIQLHDEAFRYFGGVPEECVYDQTKLVVIKEVYRELTVNQRFHAYATAADFRIHACEGYDPESKGKVEAGVKYVKQDCLYGECFTDTGAVRQHVQEWLNDVANQRLHGTTGRVPQTYFDADEKAHLRSYLAPASIVTPASVERRKSDKTGLISWQANKYSVPMAYQAAFVGVYARDQRLHITDPGNGELIATHTLSAGKGQTIKNTHHYRDHAQRIQHLEQKLRTLLGDVLGECLCAVLKATSPRIYKDQLVAAAKLLETRQPLDMALLADLAQRPSLTASALERYLDAAQRAQERGRDTADTTDINSKIDDRLSQYAVLSSVRVHSSGQEVTHECH
jgi:transposase